MESKNYIMVKGNIGGIRNGKHGHKKMFFINSFINKRDMNLMFYSKVDIPEDIEDGDKVTVEGYVAVIPVFSAAKNIYIPRQLFIAERIKKSRSNMEKMFGKEGNFYGADGVVAAFSGIITSISAPDENNKWRRMVVIVQSKESADKTESIVMDYALTKNRYSKLPDFDFEVGDNVEAICSITTSMKEISGEKRFFQDFKIEDITKAD